MYTNFEILNKELLSGDADDSLLNTICEAHTYDECKGLFSEYIKLYKSHEDPIYADFLKVVEARTKLSYLTEEELSQLQEIVMEQY